ncbi:MAG: cation:proton antiporter regulatory subunit [Acidimicrobiales bacterium]
MSTSDSRHRPVGGDVTEVPLPGIGQRYDLRAVEGGSVTVVIHHTGRRDLYVLDGGDEPRAAVTLTDSQARALGAILGGAYFKPAVIEELEAVIDGLLIDWVTLDENSPAAGKTIAELELRKSTKMTVAAIVRRGVPLVAPEPTEILSPGDRLIVIGRQQDMGGFRRQVVRS